MQRHLLAVMVGVIGFGLASLAFAQPAPAPSSVDETETKTKSLDETIRDVFGESGVELITSPKGKIDQITNDLGEVVSVEARDEVVLVSEKINLNSDFLLIDVKGQKVLATGNVYLKIQDKTAICGRFEYDIAKKMTILRENPRIIGAGDTGGSSSLDASSCEIIIQEDATGKSNTMFRGCESTKNRVKIGGDQQETPTPRKPGNGATAIDPNNAGDVGRIIGGDQTQSGSSNTETPPAPGAAPVIPAP